MNGGALVELPALRAGSWIGVTIETTELAGSAVAVVTIRASGKAIKRRWFPDENSALAHAAEQSERLELPLFDLREPAGI